MSALITASVFLRPESTFTTQASGDTVSVWVDDRWSTQGRPDDLLRYAAAIIAAVEAERSRSAVA